MVEVVFGSRNPSKFERMRSLFARVGVDLLDGATLDVADVIEGPSVPENAERKARAYAAASAKPAIATDYGLVIEGLPEEDQPNAHVRRLRHDGEPVEDDLLLDHYRRTIERVGGSAQGKWTAVLALAFDADDVSSTVAELTRRWIAVPSDVRRPGEPLASLQIDTESGRYVSEVDVETRASRPNQMDAAFLDFVARLVPRLQSPSNSRTR